MVNRVIVKMSCDDISCHIVRRMLHRGKGIDILTHRKHDDTAGMLPCAPSNAGTPSHNTVNLAISLPLSPLLVIIFHIAECRFVRQGRNGSCTIRLTSAKNNFRIFMRLTLILSRKV